MSHSETNYQNRIGNYPGDRTENPGFSNPNQENSSNSALAVQPRSRLATRLHEAPQEPNTNSGVAKTYRAIADIGSEAAEAGTKVTQSTASGIKRLFTAQFGPESNSATKQTGLGILGAVFGVAGIKNFIDIFKKLIGKGGEGKSPLLFTAAKLLTSTALATGITKTILGHSGFINMSTIMFGVVIYGLLNLFTSSYDNENSWGGKLLAALGLRNRTSSVMDSVASLGNIGNKEDGLK